MHAYIIVARNKNKAQEKIIEIINAGDYKRIDFNLQKIEDTRDLKKLTKFSFSDKTAFVIDDIDKATNESLNAFLKNLEEPGKNVIYLLTASNIANVLPTIVSRCEVITLGNEENTEFSKEIVNFENLSLDEKFEFVSKIKDRNEAISFIENLIYFNHQNKNFNNMENCLKTLNNLKVNGNVSLQLANFVVTMNR